MSVAGTHMMVACENKTRSMSCGASRSCRSGTRLPHIACSSFQLGRACTHAMNPFGSLQMHGHMLTALCHSGGTRDAGEATAHKHMVSTTPRGLTSAPLASRDITRHGRRFVRSGSPIMID